jgi:hypothetical protein
MNGTPAWEVIVDIATLMTELQIRGFSEDNIDSALRCLVHVYAVQDQASEDKAGILADDIIGSYSSDVVQSAIELFLEKGKSGPHMVYRVRWGFEDAARTLKSQLWDNSAHRWDEFVSNVNERYLGFFLSPLSGNDRVISTWGLERELGWFSEAVPRHGWNVQRIIGDVSAIAWELDLAFGFRPYSPEGIGGEMALLHERAFEALQRKALPPPQEAVNAIKFWKFFSEYDVKSTNFEALIARCGLNLKQVQEQTDRFFAKNLTSQYREGQYPPYFVNDKKKKEFREEVESLLQPMDAWLSRGEIPQEVKPPEDLGPDPNGLETQGNSASAQANILMTVGTETGSQV